MSEYKIAVAGDGGVGKSTLTIQFVQHVFVEDYDPTIEDSYRKQVIVDGTTSLIEILDVAGPENYSALREQWFRNADGFALIYSITNRNSFNQINNIRDEIARIKDDDNVAFVLVGNKSDLQAERVISTEEGYHLAQQFGCPFLETTAKQNVNVDELFYELVRQIRKRAHISK